MDTKGNFGTSYDTNSDFGTNFEQNIENFETSFMFPYNSVEKVREDSIVKQPYSAFINAITCIMILYFLLKTKTFHGFLLIFSVLLFVYFVLLFAYFVLLFIFVVIFVVFHSLIVFFYFRFL